MSRLFDPYSLFQNLPGWTMPGQTTSSLLNVSILKVWGPCSFLRASVRMSPMHRIPTPVTTCLIVAPRSMNIYFNSLARVSPHKPTSLWLTNTAHHHLAIAIVFSHMFKTNFCIGHTMKEVMEAHTPQGGRLGRGHKGL